MHDQAWPTLCPLQTYGRPLLCSWFLIALPPHVGVAIPHARTQKKPTHPQTPRAHALLSLAPQPISTNSLLRLGTQILDLQDPHTRLCHLQYHTPALCPHTNSLFRLGTQVADLQDPHALAAAPARGEVIPLKQEPQWLGGAVGAGEGRGVLQAERKGRQEGVGRRWRGMSTCVGRQRSGLQAARLAAGGEHLPGCKRWRTSEGWRARTQACRPPRSGLQPRPAHAVHAPPGGRTAASHR